MDIIYYHAACPDGFCAAFIAKKRYPGAVAIGLNHGLTEAELDKIFADSMHKDVLMVDFSFKTRDLNDQMDRVAKSFCILDHHKTAQAVLEGAPYATFDMKRSGAGLTWDYLFGKDSTISDCAGGQMKPFVYAVRPWYVDYVEDRDLWNWKLPNSREICAYLGTLKFTFEDWAKLDLLLPTDAISFGTGALLHIEHYVREAVAKAQTGHLAGAKVAILNVPYLNCSEVGNELAKTHDFSMTWYEDGDRIRFSLRSIGDIDVSQTAVRHGGGGHKNAAGFEMSLFDGRKLIDAALNRDVADRNFGRCVQ